MTKVALQTALPEDEFLLRHLPGNSAAMRQLRESVSVLNSHRGTGLVNLVLIRGGSGVGKGYVARVLAAHRQWQKIRESDRDPGMDAGMKPYLTEFQSVLLPALPEGLVESELFGHMKGSFSGALKDRKGYLAQNYSDILLDEIGDASAPLQAKLLGVLEDRQSLPIGAEKDEEVEVSARLLAATNKNIEDLVRQGKFREDLYWRLIEHPIIVPTLREQSENIPNLCDNIIAELCRNMAGLDVSDKAKLSIGDLTWAGAYEWPGNVRQLKHALRLWLLDHMKTSLREIVERTQVLTIGSAVENRGVEDWVRAHLDECLDSDGSVGSLSDLGQAFTRQFETAVYNWYRDHQGELTDDVLQRLFPRMKLSSLKTKLSQWKGRNR